MTGKGSDILDRTSLLSIKKYSFFLLLDKSITEYIPPNSVIVVVGFLR